MERNEIISAYIRAKETEKAAKKEAETMKAYILEMIGTGDTLTTDGYTVIAKRTTSTRLDTAALYKDFPDVKKEYSKQTTSTELVITEATQAAQKTA